MLWPVTLFIFSSTTYNSTMIYTIEYYIIYTYTLCSRLMYGARTDFINSTYLSIILYYIRIHSSVLSSSSRLSRVNAGIIWLLMLTIIYTSYCVYYVDCNKTLYTCRTMTFGLYSKIIIGLESCIYDIYLYVYYSSTRGV